MKYIVLPLIKFIGILFVYIVVIMYLVIGYPFKLIMYILNVIWHFKIKNDYICNLIYVRGLDSEYPKWSYLGYRYIDVIKSPIAFLSGEIEYAKEF